MVQDEAVQRHDQADNQQCPYEKPIICNADLPIDFQPRTGNISSRFMSSAQQMPHCRNTADSRPADAEQRSQPQRHQPGHNHPLPHREREQSGQTAIGAHPDREDMGDIPIRKGSAVPCRHIQQDRQNRNPQIYQPVPANPLSSVHSLPPCTRSPILLRFRRKKKMNTVTCSSFSRHGHKAAYFMTISFHPSDGTIEIYVFPVFSLISSLVPFL